MYITTVTNEYQVTESKWTLERRQSFFFYFGAGNFRKGWFCVFGDYSYTEWFQHSFRACRKPIYPCIWFAENIGNTQVSNTQGKNPRDLLCMLISYIVIRTQIEYSHPARIWSFYDWPSDIDAGCVVRKEKEQREEEEEEKKKKKPVCQGSRLIDGRQSIIGRSAPRPRYSAVGVPALLFGESS